GEPADRLLGLDERTVEDLARAHGQARAGLIAQLEAQLQAPALDDLAHPHFEFGQDGFERRVARPLVEVGASENQREFWHGQPPSLTKRRTGPAEIDIRKK